MAPERPFKAELIAFRRALRRPRVSGDLGPDGVGNHNSADVEHLERWEGDCRLEEIWREFRALNPTTTSKEFISRVLKARRNANALLNRISQSKHWRKELHKHYAERANDIFARQESLLDTAGDLLALFYNMRAAAVAFEIAENSLLPQNSPRVSRQNKTQKREDKTQRDDNWRVRKLCIAELSNFWREHCGRWSDAEVAALTEIAFPGTEISAEQVRNVRRSMAVEGKAMTGELSQEKLARVHQ
jgi:hypothetical protein